MRNLQLTRANTQFCEMTDLDFTAAALFPQYTDFVHHEKFFAVEACIANSAVRSEDSQEVHEAEPLRDVPSLQAQPWLWETGVCSVAPILQSSSYGLVALEIPACHDRSRRSLAVVCGSRAPDPGGASADSRGSPDEASCSGASLG